MLVKDKGIIIRQVKYNDKANIVTIFTRKSGKKSFILYGINSKRGSLLRNIVQPLYLVDIEYSFKSTRNLGQLKNIALSNPYSTISIDLNKKTVLLFLSEVLNKVLHEHLQDEQLFDFIYNALLYYDLNEKKIANFHLAFLIKLLRYLGLEPENNFDEQSRSFFDIKNARFTGIYEKNYSFDSRLSSILSQFLSIDFSDFWKVAVTRENRRDLLRELMNFYAYHIESFGQVNSLEVLEELFD